MEIGKKVRAMQESDQHRFKGWNNMRIDVF
jgi:hypothetical protein